MYRIAFAFCLVIITAAPAYAGQAEAREVARINNCNPKKIEVYDNQLGAAGKVIYQVACNIPKTTGSGGGAPDALLISCDQALCEMLRPVSSEKK